MDNLEFYNKYRKPPTEALKTIKGGKLNGFTDINPMWRIKVLTETFGMCGIGWYFDIVSSKVEILPDSNQELAVTVVGNLYVKVDGEWSKPIYGVGGSKLLASEKGALRLSDEAYKMASTDALSVACKNLGIGADIYWDGDNTKYTQGGQSTDAKPASTSNSKASTAAPSERDKVVSEILKRAHEYGFSDEDVAKTYKINKSTSVDRLKEVLNDLNKKPDDFAAIDEDVPWQRR